MKEPIDVIVVEDDEDLRMLITSILKISSIRVTECAGVHELQHKLQIYMPKLVISDMLLSGSDGKEVCQLIKSDESTRDIRILMMSAFPGVEETCLASGADAFMNKPFDIDELTKTVQKMIA